jgi:hypothetical protein
MFNKGLGFFTALIISLNVFASKENFMSPELLANMEAHAWQAYYKKDNEALFADVRNLFELQYGLTQAQANIVAMDYAKAAAVFSSLPDTTSAADYDKNVLPLLLKAYGTLHTYFPIHDYQAAAKYDLKWWIDRRQPLTADPTSVGDSMAKMYSAIYGDKNIRDLQRAAYLRAVAGQYRDLSHDKLGGPTQEDWSIVTMTLIQAYQILNKAIS